MRRWLFCAVAALVGCSVDDSRVHCRDPLSDCSPGEECYLGFCIAGDSGTRTESFPARGTGSSSSSRTARDDGGEDDRDAETKAEPARPRSTTADAGKPKPASPAIQPQSQPDEEDAAVAESCKNALACYAGPEGTQGVGLCRAGRRPCTNGELGACTGSVLPAKESCNRRDDDCDGKSDEGFDLKTDVAHCGTCDVSCKTGQLCKDSTCTDPKPVAVQGCSDDAPCAQGESCCDGQCVNLKSDGANCGACGRTCGKQAGCCDSRCTDLTSDDHCGSCGTACGVLGGLFCSCHVEENGEARCRSVLLDLCI